MIFKKSSRVIRVIDRANDRRCRPSNPLLDSPWTAFISWHGFLPAHNETVRAQRYALAHSLCDSSRQMREACPECVRERELSPRRNRRKRESGRNEKEEKERYLIDEVRRTQKKKKKKESLRPAQLRIRTSPSILITGHGRKEFVKILNVRAFFRADN